MDDRDVITALRQLKNKNLLSKELRKVIELVQGIHSIDTVEKAGYLLRDITINDWTESRESEVKEVKISIVSNFTCASAAHYLRTFMIEHRLWPNIYLADFNQYFYELLNKNSHLYKFNPDVTICLLDEQIILNELSASWQIEDLDALVENKINEFKQLLHVYEENCDGIIMFNTFPISPNTYDTFLDYRTKARLSRKWRELESGMLELTEQHEQAIVLDMNVLLQKLKTSALPDPRLVYYASMNMSESLLVEITKEAVKVLRAQQGLTKKCIILDLDNTLWGGVIGDDGMEGIQLGNEYPGNTYVEFQKKIKRLKEQGILLTICSKNEEKNVKEILSSHPDMQLREEDFVMIYANWEPKHENIKKIAERLNIGMDSLVFIDDSPFERDLVGNHIEQVAVLQISGDSSYYASDLLCGGWFNTLVLTEEDMKRTDKYRQQEERQNLKNYASSLDEYLHGLGIQLSISYLNSFNLSRLTQLNLRTNQFNMTTRRYQQSEMERMMNDDKFTIFSFKVQDKFGDYGVIGSIILQRDLEKQGEVWWIRNFLMSCRVFSRGIETAVLHKMIELARENEVQQLYAEYIPSKKNEVVKDFYISHGFYLINEENSHQIFVHDLKNILKEAPWITVQMDSEEVTAT
ncbi:HAD-IIIC family phosphatase [Metabacillus fastidiosus]|uniref:HAD-IIIC family phosphatase n=1 Tax=Metabacillus fastidiosus TaxID=1458 RepID=UPI003D2AAF21